MLDTEKIREMISECSMLTYPTGVVLEFCDEVDRLREENADQASLLDEQNECISDLMETLDDHQERIDAQEEEIAELEKEIMQLRKEKSLLEGIVRFHSISSNERSEAELESLKGACTNLIPRQKLTEVIKDVLEREYYRSYATDCLKKVLREYGAE